MALAERYLRFARVEAKGHSRLYADWARHVAGSARALAFLGDLPPDRRQPNLFFAALRLVGGLPEAGAAFDDVLAREGVAIAAVMRARRTQTNEPGRCACLLPLLARLDGPLALIEVGASAGLCLLPDLYGYDWGPARLDPPGGARAPVFPCRVNDRAPLPGQHPEIVWRAGLDLSPPDLGDAGDVAWLEALVWPEQSERLARLRQAVAVARQAPPPVVAGDLTRDLAALIAPVDARLVVMHSAVLTYVSDPGARADFARLMRTRDLHWISNEAPGVFPDHAKGLTPRADKFLMALDGRPVAWTGPHGQSLDWL
ncbi:DUF2332 domain-containing protein [Ruegeria aquimaris]|uniref:DUF2332 domain-containing protein n=1 Tax=Ruegeria aquimaris TaxID=2984333 RepID=A0ABT3AIY2_9RHOB|nr:DUF2332 domain-containing protein [Ruegeria sp. XHP0148]MCV2888638.1 DUF2332 domain-containing protein [Ruegeria sp. XHP0148]